MYTAVKVHAQVATGGSQQDVPVQCTGTGTIQGTGTIGNKVTMYPRSLYLV